MKRSRATVLVVDGGGRGSALVHKYSKSPHVGRILAAPGNDLMQINSNKPVKTFSKVATINLRAIEKICEEEHITLVDVAQDNAIEAGLGDRLQQRGFNVVGPTRLAGRIEWDKSWARTLGEKAGLPQPSFKICRSKKEGVGYLKKQVDQPWFIKANGLCEGKGVLHAKNKKEAVEQISELRKRFGKKADIYLLEKALDGEEFSSFVFCDGRNFWFAGSAQDHKRANDFDQGENTGGMGCSTPPLALTPSILEKIKKGIFQKVLDELSACGSPYRGILYLGGMLVGNGNNQEPYVIEFNARWGDPEAPVILSGITSDLFEINFALSKGTASGLKLENDGKARVVVAGVVRGYPGDYKSLIGKRIFGIEKARKISGVTIYGAGVKRLSGKDFVSGGRLFYVVGEGKTVIDARQKAYEAMSIINIEGNNLHFRTDIGWRDVERICVS